MTDITPYLNRLDILNETALQIIKDFGINGHEIKFSGNKEGAYQELFSQILPIVEKLQKENFRNFYNLMYRIDISESQIKKAVELAADKSFSEIVTDLTLKRELLKVVTRKKLSSK
ncbi:MAG: hypothetical protein EPN85_12510 [Bacteroidetes bacterium]|nr:MAG: hypothetical protein EPN85_12510 [Bacteroidota bacterium]